MRNGAERWQAQLAAAIVGCTYLVELLLATENEQRGEQQAGEHRHRHVEDDARLDGFKRTVCAIDDRDIVRLDAGFGVELVIPCIEQVVELARVARVALQYAELHGLVLLV